jgi:hypothetical protein
MELVCGIWECGGDKVTQRTELQAEAVENSQAFRYRSETTTSHFGFNLVKKIYLSALVAM